MNDPSTDNSQSPRQLLSFFNYHEYLTDYYVSTNDMKSAHQDGSTMAAPDNTHHDVSLVINHFPNPYTTVHSALYHSTRIVRIPRSFVTHENLYIVPQFSTYVPGEEPAAITASGKAFESIGMFDGTTFGVTSATPLVPMYLSSEELGEIIVNINKLSAAASLPSSISTLENVLDLFTGTLYSRVFGGRENGTHAKRKIAELETYVETLNRDFLQKRHGLLCLISPVKSAFLSLDFQIPKPMGSELSPKNSLP